MDNIIEFDDDIMAEVMNTLTDLGEGVLEHLKTYAPQYLRYMIYALRGLR